jgi:hypothetical protein
MLRGLAFEPQLRTNGRRPLEHLPRRRSRDRT